ncbi:MAG: P1 family peptidase [Chromatiales bacterium]|nr:P1 family peptidase [Chromatiales bacterium]
MALGVEGVRVGMWTDPEHQTGCTVVLPPAGTVGGIAVRGGAPGTREAAVLSPASPNEACHAVVLCGSSLFGLRAADGVVDWCEAHGIGLDLAVGRFPIVGAAVVLDIRGPEMRRIDRDAGWAACEAATTDEPASGSVGVGAGCTVGKEAGLRWASKGGQGSAVRRWGDVTVGALVAVNALGSVFGEDGRVIAGCRAPEDRPRYPFAPLSILRAGGEEGASSGDAGSASNTVIGCVVTNARLRKPQVCRIADLGHTGIARAVSPAHTSLDGDALFALATGEVDTSVDLVAELAARAVADAVREGVRHARSMPGFPVDPRVRPAPRSI